MKIFKSFSYGFTSAFKIKKLVTLIYLITLFLALIIAIPFKSIIEIEAGNSMAFASLIKDFDYTVYKDFMNHSGDTLKPFIPLAIWMGTFYLLFTIFFEGGILSILKLRENKYSLRTFWESSAKYFLKFFRLAVYSIILQVLIAIAVYIPLGTILDSANNSVESETSLVYIILIGIIIHLIFFLFILMVTDYAKIIIVESEWRKPFKSFLESFGFVFKNFGAYFLYLILLIVPVILFLFYFWVEEGIGMTAGLKIFIIFIIQQILIWCRVYIKIWILGSELEFYRNSAGKHDAAERIPVFEV